MPPPEPFWSPAAEIVSGMCVYPTLDARRHSRLSWASLGHHPPSGLSGVPDLSVLGQPNFVPCVEGIKLPAERVRKIKLKPTHAQRQTLNGWFSTARWTYNRCVHAINELSCERSKKALRAQCVNNALWTEGLEWVKKTPYDIRDEAMNDVLKAYKTNFAAKRKQFKIKFKSRKAPSDSIVIHSKHWKSAGIMHPQAWGKQALDAHEALPDNLPYDCRLQRTRLGEFYLCLLSPLKSRDSQAKRRVVSLDPGVRTFQTLYSPDGSVEEIGAGDIGRISRLCWSLDKLQSKWSQPEIRHRKRYTMQRAGRQLRAKIKNLVHTLHHTVARHLCESYNQILIPVFETKNMVSKIKRRIGSQTARMMLTWSHYRFRKILEDKAREYPDCNVFVVDEAYTSKTCGRCGSLHDGLGKSKVFKCPSCDFTLDRDVNGARNILIRFLTTDERVRQAGLRWGLAPGPL
jgi:putative transposase